MHWYSHTYLEVIAVGLIKARRKYQPMALGAHEDALVIECLCGLGEGGRGEKGVDHCM